VFVVFWSVLCVITGNVLWRFCVAVITLVKQILVTGLRMKCASISEVAREVVNAVVGFVIRVRVGVLDGGEVGASGGACTVKHMPGKSAVFGISKLICEVLP